MADIDATLVQQILNIPKRKWISNVHHHRQADDLGAGSKVPKGAEFCHSSNVGDCPARLKAIPSDIAIHGVEFKDKIKQRQNAA